MFQFFSLERIKALSSRPLFSRSMRAQREVRIKKTEGRSRVKVAFFSRLKEIKIPLLSLFTLYSSQREFPLASALEVFDEKESL
jgi:hypothetical protein